MPWKNSWFQLAALVAVICGTLLIYDLIGSPSAQDDSDSSMEFATTAPVVPPSTPPIPPPVAGKEWTNSLGMKFVPAGMDKVLFCIWDVRVKDYAAFVGETGHDRVQTDFPQTDNDPVVNVSWDDADAFCQWLTRKERAGGDLTDNQRYRLPTDAEWSKAVGLNEIMPGSPWAKSHLGSGQYPWGTEWPPPKEAGNYWEGVRPDGYTNTSPVGIFSANQYGLFDMGGNVSQWCQSKYGDPFVSDWKDYRVTRGAPFDQGIQSEMLSSCRGAGSHDNRQRDLGFRVVIVVSP